MLRSPATPALLLLALLPLILAQPTSVKVAFPKFATPTGYTRYDESALSGTGVNFFFGGLDIPFPFRSVVRAPETFAYRILVAPGAYTVKLGFIEFGDCREAARVFKVNVNGKTTADLDVFMAVGCKTPYIVTLTAVQASKGELVVTPTKVSGWAPVLANVEVTRAGGSSGPAPTPTVSPASMSGGGGAVGNPAPTENVKGVYSIDVSGEGDLPDQVVGGSNVYPNVFPIAGTTEDAKFSKHRFGKNFAYVLTVQANVRYSVQLFFAESFMPGCREGFRKFDVSVYDGNLAPTSGKMVTDVDVFASAGCCTVYSFWITDVTVGASGKLAIRFTGTVENAMVSALDVVTTDPNYTQVVTGTPGPTGSTQTSVIIDVGGASDVLVPGTKVATSALAVQGTTNIAAAALKTARTGSDFTYSFNLKPGAYDILLGFSENGDPNYCSVPAKRVFNVYVDGLIQLEGYDIFANAGCRKGIEVLLPALTVGAVEVSALKLRFASVVSFAQINYIKVSPAVNSCVPESSTGDLAADHAAHAVPGSYPPQLFADAPKTFVDSDGNGFESVFINGQRSHSHFFDSANDIVGRITDYVWTNVDTGAVLAREAKFQYKFPLGTTRLKLAVTDNSCSRDEAETTVTVTGARQPGMYCYYFDGLTAVPLVGPGAASQQAQFSAVAPSARLRFPQFEFDKTKFATRCQFFFETDVTAANALVSVATGGTGVAKLYKGEDLIFDTTSSQRIRTDLAVGLTSFEIVYLRTSLDRPVLRFVVNGRVPADGMITHDRTTVVPILTGISPNDGQVEGGARIKLTGHGLYLPMKVNWGGTVLFAMTADNSPTQFFVKSPPANGVTAVKVFAVSKSGEKSNSVDFSYGSTCPPISFDRKFIKQPDGSDVDFLKLPTSAALGSDGKIYMGTLGGSVQVLGYNSLTLKSTSHCYSKVIRDLRWKKGTFPSVRDILGITFDPRDKMLRPYVTTSTIFWRERNTINLSEKQAWLNGAVDRLKPGSDPVDTKICLVYDKRIVSGLPVSNHDHSVNSLLFTQNGDLLISVGGNTNMGLPGYKLGSYWETHLSAAILIARLSKPDFNGNIEYSNADNLRLAKKTSGDVDLYATGLRNSFKMMMNSDGLIYASDNGPNCGFGDIASSCSEYKENIARDWDLDAQIDWKGLVPSGWPSCPNSLGRPDKILRVVAGKFYGHANLNRGGNECAWIDPYTHKTADNKPSPANYKRQMATVQSPITGLDEYRANHFCGRLKGEFILSTYKSGKTWRMKANRDAVVSGPDSIMGDGGITFVENAHGDLIFPRLSEKNVFVLRPKVGVQAGVYVAGAVPFRHGRQGGTRIIVGGSGFGTGAVVMIGGKGCVVNMRSDTEITCTVPAHTPGSKSLTVTSDGQTAVLDSAVLYMSR